MLQQVMVAVRRADYFNQQTIIIITRPPVSNGLTSS
jgi:hypothetical protein